MDDLTKSVMSGLSQRQRATLDEILDAKKLVYVPKDGTPNIELLSDLVTEYSMTQPDSKYGDLEAEIRRLIIGAILSVTTPDLTHHVRFLEALKQRTHGTPGNVTIFTTNYDILFELAAGEVGIRFETGFDGPLRRVFDPIVFALTRGTVEKNRFSPRAELHINIVKLHGSISWRKCGNRVYESGLSMNDLSEERCLILPRQRKVMDTLADPFDQIFTHASYILGSGCKYVVTCGFSFGDKHINDQLIIPKLAAGQVRMTALCGAKPDGLDDLMAFPSFSAGFPDRCYINGEDSGVGTDLWRFSSLAELIEP